MKTSYLTKKAVKAPTADYLLYLSSQTWVESTNTAIKLQCIWLATLNDATRHELEFLSTLMTSYSKISSCMLDSKGLQTPSSVASCYHEIAGNMAQATLNRMLKVSELTDDLRERIWCEI